ncbi:MAG TPA: oligosaccharide flippase family protein [Woeseiaceae bacterium]
MASLIRSSLILAFARATNLALLFLSPILLVRLLDPATFGQYREFIAWAMITIAIAGFSISTNLLYFIPRDPQNANRYVSHTNWFSLIASALAFALLWAFRDRIHANASFDLVLPLATYAFLYLNLAYLDTYWIATRQPKYVFYYSTARTIIRLAAVIGTAWVTGSIEAIVVSLVLVEAVRLISVLIISQRIGLLSFQFDRRLIPEQLRFILPLGLATSLAQVHQYIGQLVISTQLGVLALAIYSVASYKAPVIRIVRGAISDAIFPEMVRRAAGRAVDGLRLWKRGTIGYAFLILPSFMLLFWYADVLIPLVFTQQYADAVPIFRILLLVMPLEAIELNTPLRAINRTPDMLAGNALLLGTNVLCIVAFFRWLPEQAILGPAVGTVAGYVAQLCFLGSRILRWYEIRLADLMKWRSLGAIWLCTIGVAAVLAAGEYVPMPELARMLVFGTLYGGAYLVAIRLFRLEEVETLFFKLRRRLARAPA